MTARYLIQEIDSNKFWSSIYRQFREFIYSEQFETEEKALTFAEKECVGIFKITKIYDTK